MVGVGERGEESQIQYTGLFLTTLVLCYLYLTSDWAQSTEQFALHLTDVSNVPGAKHLGFHPAYFAQATDTSDPWIPRIEAACRSSSVYLYYFATRFYEVHLFTTVTTTFVTTDLTFFSGFMLISLN